jgi:hypothetical protein
MNGGVVAGVALGLAGPASGLGLRSLAASVFAPDVAFPVAPRGEVIWVREGILAPA